MFCRECGAEVHPGDTFCMYCGARIGPVNTPAPKKKNGSLLGVVAIVAMIVAGTLAMGLVTWDDFFESEPTWTEGDVTLVGGLVHGMDDGGLVVSETTLPITLVCTETTGNVKWLVRDNGESYVQNIEGQYERRHFDTTYSNSMTFTEPGIYEVYVQVDGITSMSGDVIVDGTVSKTYEWTRMVSGIPRMYHVEWDFRFSDYMEYRDSDTFRWDIGINKERFAVVDNDILSLESALWNEYVRVHGPSAEKCTQDYADYLLSFVQCVIDYPPMIEKTGNGYSLDKEDGSPDTYLYGRSEYWAFPMETLYMGQGDCEDTSFLTVSLFSAAGYRSALGAPPNHMIALVAIPNYTDNALFELTHRNFCNDPIQLSSSGERYWFCETTYDSAVPCGYYGLHQRTDLLGLDEVTLVPPYVAVH